jgi:hypothetical protein
MELPNPLMAKKLVKPHRSRYHRVHILQSTLKVKLELRRWWTGVPSRQRVPRLILEVANVKEHPPNLVSVSDRKF